MIKDRDVINEIIQSYNGGIKVCEIAQKANVAPATIYSILYREGAQVRPVGRPKHKTEVVNQKVKKAKKLVNSEKSSLEDRLKLCRDNHVVLSTQLEAKGEDDNSAIASMIAGLLSSLLRGEEGRTIELF